jgi:hypothetical protein
MEILRSADIDMIIDGCLFRVAAAQKDAMKAACTRPI